MSTRKLTSIIMLVSAAILIIYDIWAVVTEPGNDSISRILADIGREHYSIPFAMGTLLGHWFWPREKDLFGISSMRSFLFILLPLFLLLAAVDVFVALPLWAMPLMPLAGYFTGHFLWPLRARK